MDVKDKRLLYYLGKDATLSYSQLSKLVRMSQETVRYRINNLVKQGIIEKFVTVLNPLKLGITPYQLFFKLQSLDEEAKTKMVNILKSDPRILWIANTEGEYDLAIIMGVKNLLDFREVVEKIYKLFRKKIIKKTLSVHISTEFFPRDYLIEKMREKFSYPNYFPDNKIIELDKINYKICELLSKDGRISLVDIASKIGLSADAIAQRIKKLTKDKLIIGSIIILNQEKMNTLYYKIILYLNDLSEEKVNSLLNQIKSNTRVVACVQTLAEWDYEIDIEVGHPNQLREFIMNLTKEFSDIIRDYETIRIIDMPKYSFIA